MQTAHSTKIQLNGARSVLYGLLVTNVNYEQQ